MDDRKIVEFDDLRKRRALDAYHKLPLEKKRYVKLIKNDFNDAAQIPWGDIPKELHEIIQILDGNDLTLG